MGYYTLESRRWFDRRFRLTDEDGTYRGHQPIYGFGDPHSEPHHLPRLARTFQILRALVPLEMETFLDVGGGEGYLTYLVQTLFGAKGISLDLAAEGGKRARQLFDVDAVASDSCRLPFKDATFDVVLCSEVLEHVELAVETILELLRVARRAVVITTEEIALDRDEVLSRLAGRRELPHPDRNFFHPDDFRLLLGPGIAMRSQISVRAFPEDRADQDARSWILDHSKDRDLTSEGLGVVLVHRLEQDALPRGRALSDQDILNVLFETKVPHQPIRSAPDLCPGSFVLQRVVCPLCLGGFVESGGELSCRSCGRVYPAAEGVPCLYVEDAPDPDLADLEERLKRQWPGEDDRIDQAIELRQRLMLPERDAKSDWDFSLEDARKAWELNQQLEVRIVEKPIAFHLRSKGFDPWLISPRIGLPTAQVNSIELVYSGHNPDLNVPAGEGQVFWMTDSDLGFAGERSVTFEVPNDGRVHHHRIELRDRNCWPRDGTLLWLRLDPVNAPADVDLIAVRIHRGQ